MPPEWSAQRGGAVGAASRAATCPARLAGPTPPSRVRSMYLPAPRPQGCAPGRADPPEEESEKSPPRPCPPRRDGLQNKNHLTLPSPRAGERWNFQRVRASNPLSPWGSNSRRVFFDNSVAVRVASQKRRWGSASGRFPAAVSCETSQHELERAQDRYSAHPNAGGR